MFIILVMFKINEQQLKIEQKKYLNLFGFPLGYLYNINVNKNNLRMTNIEFLVNELRKANENIDALRKQTVYLMKRNNELVERNKKLVAKVNGESKNVSQSFPNLADIDALAALRKELNE